MNESKKRDGFERDVRGVGGVGSLWENSELKFFDSCVTKGNSWGDTPDTPDIYQSLKGKLGGFLLSNRGGNP